MVIKDVYTNLSLHSNYLQDAKLKNITVVAADDTLVNGELTFTTNDNFGADSKVVVLQVKQNDVVVPVVVSNLDNVKTSTLDYSTTTAANDTDVVLVFDGTQLLKSTVKLGDKVDFGDIKLSVKTNDANAELITLLYNTKPDATLDDATWTTNSADARQVALQINTVTSANTNYDTDWTDKKLSTAGAVLKLVNDKVSGLSYKGTVLISRASAAAAYNKVILAEDLVYNDPVTTGQTVTVPAGTALETTNDSFKVDELNGTLFKVKVLADDEKSTAPTGWIEPVTDQEHSDYQVAFDGTGTSVVHVANSDTVIINYKNETLSFTHLSNSSDSVDLTSNQTVDGVKTFKKIVVDLKQDTTNGINNIITNAVVQDKDAGEGTKGIFASGLSVTVKDGDSGTKTVSQDVLLVDKPVLEVLDSGNNGFATVTDVSAGTTTYYNPAYASASKVVTELALAKALKDFQPDTGNDDEEFFEALDLGTPLTLTSEDGDYKVYKLEIKTSDFLGVKNEEDTSDTDYWGHADGEGRWLVVVYGEIVRLLIDNETVVCNDSLVTNFTFDANTVRPSDVKTDLDVANSPVVYTYKFQTTEDLSGKNVKIYVHGTKGYRA